MTQELSNNEKEHGLTPKEASAFIGCSESMIKQMARERKIPHYRIGVRILFSKDALEKWIVSQEKRNYL